MASGPIASWQIWGNNGNRERLYFWGGSKITALGDCSHEIKRHLLLGSNEHESEQALGIGDGQGSLACCSPWGYKESDTTERLN